MGWLISILVIILVYIGVKKILKRLSRKRGLKDIPGPRQHPLLGNARQLERSKLHMTLYEWGKKYGKIFQFKVFGIQYINLSSEEMIESASEIFFNRPYHINKTINYDGNGVLYSDDQFLVNETKRAMLEVASMPVIQTLCEKELNRLIAELNKANGNEGLVINDIMMATVCRHTLIYGLGCDAEEKEQTVTLEYLKDLVAFFDGPASVLTAMPWLRFIPGKFKRAFNANKSKKTQMVECLVNKSEVSRESGIGLIQHLMDRKSFLDKSGEKRSLELENIYGIVVDAIAGGIIPMASILTSTLLCIMANDSIQERIHDELNIICKSKPPTDGDQDRLPYLTATILEGFRYISVLTTAVPHTVNVDTEFHGYLLEKGAVIMNNLCNLHHDDDVWRDSWNFRPERFLNESGHLLPSDHTYRKSVKLFGSGPRFCKGNPFVIPLIFRIISTIMYHFKVLPPLNDNLPDSDPSNFKFGAVLEIPEVCCRFKPRL